MSAVIDTKTIYFCSNDRETMYRENLLVTGHGADCEFLVGHKKTKFSGHRLYLVAASEKMEALLKDAVGPVVINDVEADVFRELLHAIYTYRIALNNTDFAFKLAKVAKDFGMPSIRTHCMHYMSNSKGINVDTVFSILEVGSSDGDACEENVKNECWKLILSRIQTILSCEAFLKAKPETILAVYSLDNLKLISELELVDALYNYAVFHKALPVNALNQLSDQKSFENMILPALKCIRFLSIPLNEIYRSSSLAALLAPEIITGITALIIAPESACHRNCYPDDFCRITEPRTSTGSIMSISSSSRSMQNSIAYTAEVTNSNRDREETEIWDEDNIIRNGSVMLNSVHHTANQSIIMNGHDETDKTSSNDASSPAQSTPNEDYSQLVENAKQNVDETLPKKKRSEKVKTAKPRNLNDENWSED